MSVSQVSQASAGFSAVRLPSIFYRLRRLTRRLPAIPEPAPVPTEGSPLGRETALTFVTNQRYLRGLKVLLYSLHHHQALQNSPIVVLSEDRAVAEDPFVRAVATDIEFLGEDTLQPFAGLRNDKIPEHLKLSFAPKYTFLKFLLFRERGYQRHIYFDADILCLGRPDEDLLASDYDVKAVNEVGKEFPMRKESREDFRVDRALSVLEQRSAPVPGAVTSINSGFMTFQGKAISEDVFQHALQITSVSAFHNEQSATAEVLRREPGLRFLQLPIWYNTKRRVFEALGEEHFERYRNQVIFLHYTTGKPWSISPRKWNFLDALWSAYEKRADVWAKDRISRMV